MDGKTIFNFILAVFYQIRSTLKCMARLDNKLILRHRVYIGNVAVCLLGRRFFARDCRKRLKLEHLWRFVRCILVVFAQDFNRTYVVFTPN